MKLLLSCRRAGGFVLGTAALVLLAACTDSGAPLVVPPKPVKVETIAAAASAASDGFVATARAERRSDLGVDAPGRVAAVLVDVGDKVRAGQLLARLDDTPARLRLARAEADLAAAAAARSERRTAARQHEALARDQFISSAALEAVQASERQASSQWQAAEAALAAAQRDLALTRITAPYDGEIVGRNVQPHADVSPGQPLLQIEGAGAMEVVAMLPEAVAASLKPGQAARGDAGGRLLALHLLRLSAHSDNGSLVQAVFGVDGRPAALRSGSVITLDLPHAAGAGVTLPAPALMPGATPGQASVFVLDTRQGRLVRRAVRTTSALAAGGRIGIAEGLAAGDQVVVAGTSFLSEGQAAVALPAQTLLTEARP